MADRKTPTEGATAAVSLVRSIDLRAWAAIALFALTWRIIELIAKDPSLLQNASFMQLVGPIAGAGGLLLIVSFLFSSSKDDSLKTKALQDNAAAMREAGIQVGPAKEGTITEGPEKAQ